MFWLKARESDECTMQNGERRMRMKNSDKLKLELKQGRVTAEFDRLRSVVILSSDSPVQRGRISIFVQHLVLEKAQWRNRA